MAATVTNFRNTAWLAEAYRRAECPPLCALCDREDQAQDREPRRGRDLLTTPDYEEYE